MPNSMSTNMLLSHPVHVRSSGYFCKHSFISHVPVVCSQAHLELILDRWCPPTWYSNTLIKDLQVGHALVKNSKRDYSKENC